ncbi:MAG: type II secretion system F family protein [Candidatus Diapherotrites archaeon]|nr:type II secretion system F family protein [Candidatus Diapherotrites archaeon]
MVKRFSSVIAQTTPLHYTELIERQLVYAGLKIGVGLWLFGTGILSILLSIGSTILLWTLIKYELPMWLMLLPLPIFFIIFMLAFYNILVYFGKKRANQIESVLPDALQLIAANMRADIPIHKSLVLAARPEFGLLAKQLELIGEEIITGNSVDVAFEHFSQRVDSPLVRRVSTLMRESLRSGHDIAGLLEGMAHDIRTFRVLEEEARANIASYIVFIVMAVVLIAPVLYSISISFVDLSTTVRERLNIGEMRGAVASAGASLAGWITAEQSITPDTLVIFAGANLFVSAIFAALVVSVLQTGESLQNLPLVPIFVAVSLGLFIAAITVLRSVLLGMFG